MSELGITRPPAGGNENKEILESILPFDAKNKIMDFELWEDFRFHLTDTNKNKKETIFQDKAVQSFETLGWKKRKENIDREVKAQQQGVTKEMIQTKLKEIQSHMKKLGLKHLLKVSLSQKKCEDLMEEVYGKNWQKNPEARIEYYALRSAKL